MLECQHQCGRLVTVVLSSPLTLEEIAAADLKMAQAREKAGAKVVISADYRAMTLLGQAEAGALLAMFKGHNAGIERSAILSSATSALAVMQMVRIVKEAQSPTRKAFHEPAELQSWLGEVLTPEEKAALQAVFLGEPSSPN
ncbi:MAG TPA: hypothetical protein VGK67_36470 [Myxococcales bacterium]|jgi:hypothetical protein